MRVLIAEDEYLVRSHLADLLTDAGCQVICQHEDGESAVRWLEANPGAVDALFLDIRMPHLSGMEVAAWGSIPTVFVTGWADHAVQAFDLAAVDYVMKPVTLDRISKTVDRLRSLLEGEPSAETAPMVQIRSGKSREGVMSVSAVDVFEVEDREVFAWISGKRHLALGFRTLKEVEKEFPEIRFERDGRNRIKREGVS